MKTARQQMRRTSVGEELCDNAGLGDDFLIVEAGDCVFDRWHETARVDVQVPLFAGLVEVDDYFVKVQA